MGDGLNEANQVLTLNNLQGDFRTDGGIKTGRDVVIAMMGAEEYGVATTALVAMVALCRQCHSNTCPVVFVHKMKN